MIVIPPEDPDERRSDPIAEALGSLYDSIAKAQDVGRFYDTLVRRDASFQAQRQHIEDNPSEYQNLHPKDFYSEFHRQADDDDKAVLSEVPYQLRQKLKDALFDGRRSAFDRIFTVYRQKFVEHQEGLLERDRAYFLKKALDSFSDPERDRYLGLLARRLQDSAAAGIIYKETANAAIANIPNDYDEAVFNRDFAADPVRAQRLLYGTHPNLKPEQRENLLKQVTSAGTPSLEPSIGTTDNDFTEPAVFGEGANSETNKEPGETSKHQDSAPGKAWTTTQDNQLAAAQPVKPTEGNPPSGTPATADGDSAAGSIPDLPDIPKDLNGVPPDLIALIYGAASNQEAAIMEAVANAVKNRIGLNVYGLANLNTYDDVIYQWTSGAIQRDKNKKPIVDRYGNPRRQGDRPQFNEITGEQMERAYKVLTGESPASALRGPANEDALTDAFEAAENVYHGKKPDNTIPPDGGRGAVFFHDRSVPTPPDIARRVARGDLRELFPVGQNAPMRFYGYTEQGYERDRVKK